MPALQQTLEVTECADFCEGYFNLRGWKNIDSYIFAPTQLILPCSCWTFQQGELNVDVLDHDTCQKLSKWFEDRWNGRWCVDISNGLVKIIEESWARPEPIPPCYIYVKMAYHLSREACPGLFEFRIPCDFGGKLFDFQTTAVKIAAHHLNKRSGRRAATTREQFDGRIQVLEEEARLVVAPRLTPKQVVIFEPKHGLVRASYSLIKN